ncbi:hypothetical protein GGI19_004762, partial [Coemansia pectinata]
MSFVLKAVSAAKNVGRAIRVRLWIARLTSADTTAAALTADLSKHHDINHRVLLKLDSADWSAVNTSFFALEDWQKELPLSCGDHLALQDSVAAHLPAVAAHLPAAATHFPTFCGSWHIASTPVPTTPLTIAQQGIRVAESPVTFQAKFHMRSGQLLALFLLAAFVVVASRSFAISERYCNRHAICTEHVPFAFHKHTATTAHIETTETAATAEPATPAVVNSAATREAEVEGASGAVEIGKAIAAAQ